MEKINKIKPVCCDKIINNSYSKGYLSDTNFKCNNIDLITLVHSIINYFARELFVHIMLNPHIYQYVFFNDEDYYICTFYKFNNDEITVDFRIIKGKLQTFLSIYNCIKNRFSSMITN